VARFHCLSWIARIQWRIHLSSSRRPLKFVPDGSTLSIPVHKFAAFRPLPEADPATSAGKFPNSLLERTLCFIRDPAVDPATGRYPEAVAEELPLEHAGHRALGRMDREPQTAIELQQQSHPPAYLPVDCERRRSHHQRSARSGAPFVPAPCPPHPASTFVRSGESTPLTQKVIWAA
jgi:hypothetical protein